MDFVIDFLVGNYMWFLVITIILIFALIGYVVDSKEHKEVSIFDSPQELAKNLEMLAASAQNKTIGDAMKKNDQNFSVNMNPMNQSVPTNSNFQQPVQYSQNVMPSNSTSVMNSNNMMQNSQGMMQNQMGQNLTNSNSSFEVLGK